MSNNLKDLIEKNVNENDRLLTRGNQRINNQKVKEIGLKKKLKKIAIYGAILSVLSLGIYAGDYGLKKYKDYVHSKEKNVSSYQHKFDDIKKFYNKKYYSKADKLSENLQEELSKEWFFSPTKDLYEKVKDYDDNYIDVEIERINREEFYKNLSTLHIKAIDYLFNKWDDVEPSKKGFAYMGGIVLALYLLKREKKN